MKASHVLRGYLQTKIVQLPLAGIPNKGLFGGHFKDQHKADVESWKAEHPDHPEPPPPIDVGLLPLDPGKEADILACAYEYAKKRGLENPKEGDELYEYGKALYRCLFGVVDAESPSEAPERFFDGGLQQIEGMSELGRDGVLTLAEMHMAFQDEVTGKIAHLDDSPEEFRAMLDEASGPYGGALFFSLRPGLRVTSWVSMACQLHALLEIKSLSGLDADKDTKTSSGRSRKKTQDKRSDK